MDLIKAARRGREDAFLQLFAEHHLPLFRFAYRLTGSVADAEDIVQECFLELLRPQCGYDPRRASVRSYLFGFIRNKSMKRLREKHFGAKGDLVATNNSSPEGELLRTELDNVVAHAVIQLPETQREVLILAHYEQMQLAEIARALALDLRAAKSRLQRARASLKETLAEYMPSLERKK